MTIGGSIGGPEATWQPWSYQKRLETAKKVEKFKARLRDPEGKQRSEITKFIAKEKSRQEFAPPLGKYVDCVKAEPLHNTNNCWQQWFLIPHEARAEGPRVARLINLSGRRPALGS